MVCPKIVWIWHWLTFSLNVVPNVYFDVSYLVTERSNHQRWSVFKNTTIFTGKCAEVSAYQFNLPSMSWPDQCRSSNCQVFLKIQQISQENTCVGAWNYKESLLNKVAANQVCHFTKIKTPTHMFFCEICEIFKNIFLITSVDRCFYKQKAARNSCFVAYEKQIPFSKPIKPMERAMSASKNYSYLNLTQLFNQCCSVVQFYSFGF